jgi:hypothetical protein
MERTIRWSRITVSHNGVRYRIPGEEVLQGPMLRKVGQWSMGIHLQSWCGVPRNNLVVICCVWKCTRLRVVVRRGLLS